MIGAGYSHRKLYSFPDLLQPNQDLRWQRKIENLSLSFGQGMLLSAVVAQICNINKYIAPVPFVMGLLCHIQWNILTGKNNKNLIISRLLQLGKLKLIVQRIPSHTIITYIS